MLQKGVRFAVEIGSLAVLAADVDQADPRLFDAQHVSGVDGPHHRVLIQVLGPGRRIGADVHQHRRAAEIGKRDRDAGPLDSLQVEPRSHAGRDDGSGVARADDRVDGPLGHQPPADGDRRVGLACAGPRSAFPPCR